MQIRIPKCFYIPKWNIITWVVGWFSSVVLSGGAKMSLNQLFDKAEESLMDIHLFLRYFDMTDLGFIREN